MRLRPRRPLIGRVSLCVAVVILCGAAAPAMGADFADPVQGILLPATAYGLALLTTFKKNQK